MYTTADKPGTLLRATRALLGKDRRSLHAISVGSGVPFYWLRKFATGEIRSPSVNRVQRLYEYLANSKVLP